MPFVNTPDFEPRQILTAALLDQLVAALDGFAAQSSDITWPLIAGDNIDMDSQYDIVNLRRFWNVINADEYATLQAAIDVAETEGGGCVLIPPDTTVPSTGVTIEGSKVVIMGCGPSSVIQLSSGVGPLIQSDTSTRTDLGLMNLTMDGAAIASSEAFVMKGVARIQVKDVHFKDFKGASVTYEKRAGDGTACTDVLMTDVRFTGGGNSYIKCTDVARLKMRGILMDAVSAAAGGIYMEPVAAASLIQDIDIDDAYIDVSSGKGISILGFAGTAVDAQSRISIGSNVRVTDATADAIEVGAAAKQMKEVQINGAVCAGTVGASGFSVNIDKGTISGVRAPNAVAAGLDMTLSEDLDVTGCSFRDCLVGIDATLLPAASDCAAWSNNLKGSATPIDFPTVAASFDAGNNIGTKGKLMGGTVFFDINGAAAGTGTKWTYTVPGGTLSKVGDGLEITAAGNRAAGAGTTTLKVQVDANTIGESINTTPNSDQYTEGRIFLALGPDTALNSDGWGFGLSNGGEADALTNTNLTIDWTADVNITVHLTDAASVMLVRSGTVTFFEGEAGGA